MPLSKRFAIGLLVTAFAFAQAQSVVADGSGSGRGDGSECANQPDGYFAGLIFFFLWSQLNL